MAWCVQQDIALLVVSLLLCLKMLARRWVQHDGCLSSACSSTSLRCKRLVRNFATRSSNLDHPGASALSCTACLSLVDLCDVDTVEGAYGARL